jgi:hypothetical protein
MVYAALFTLMMLPIFFLSRMEAEKKRTLSEERMRNFIEAKENMRIFSKDAAPRHIKATDPAFLIDHEDGSLELHYRGVMKNGLSFAVTTREQQQDRTLSRRDWFHASLLNTMEPGDDIPSRNDWNQAIRQGRVFMDEDRNLFMIPEHAHSEAGTHFERVDFRQLEQAARHDQLWRNTETDQLYIKAPQPAKAERSASRSL